MRPTLRTVRTIGGWAPLVAALSIVVYAVALELWPLRAGHLFATLFRVDPFGLTPIQGWAEVLPGVALWIAACYAAAAGAWLLLRHTGRVARPARALNAPRAARSHS